MNETQVEALLEAAGPLGLLSTPRPCRAGYDLTIVLGGTTTANELRMKMAWDLVDQGMDAGHLVAASAHRPLTPDEEQRALQAGAPPSALRDEYSHLAWTVREHVGTNSTAHLRHGGSGEFGRWSYISLVNPGRRPVDLAQAPSRRLDRRADTLDVVEFVERMVNNQPHNVLVVTSAIYVPYTFFLLASLASSERLIEVVGTPTSYKLPRTLAQRVGQEIHATLQVMPA